jgi:hypothetical protein
MIDTNSIEIIPSLLTHHECNILNNWAILNRNKFFKKSYIAKNRLTTRFSGKYFTNLELEYPSLIIEKFNELKNKLGLSDYLNYPEGKDGIVCAITSKNGELRNHLDPKLPNSESLHFLIKTLNGGEGGEFYINDTHYPLNEGDCLIFYASVLKHKLTKITGDGDRISWFFSISIPKYINKNINENSVNIYSPKWI